MLSQQKRRLRGRIIARRLREEAMKNYPALKNWHVVDENGEFWDAHGSGLREYLFCADYGNGLMDDVIRNLGYVGLRLSNNTLRIKLDRVSVSTTALSAIIYSVADLLPETVIIDWSDSDGGNELLQTPKVAITRLCEISKKIAEQRQIKANHYDLKSAQSIASLSPIIELWTGKQGKLDANELISLAEEHVSGRYLRINVSDGEFTIAAIGYGLQIPPNARRSLHQGQRISDQRDEIYFAWVSSTYRTAIESGRPDFAHICASIFWPEVGWTRKEYSRLLLPCVDNHMSTYLFLANISVRPDDLSTAQAA
jgi:hypothetical protein